MCKNLFKRVLDWYNQPINPILLELRDKQLQAKFQAENHKMASERSTIVSAIFVLICLVTVVKDWNDHFQSLSLFVDLAPLAFLMSTITLISKKWHWVIEYLPAGILISRFALSFVQFNNIENGSIVDAKSMNDYILIAFLPAQIGLTSATRIELFVTFPISLIANIIVVLKSYSNKGDNMTCFKNPDLFLQRQIVESTCLMLIVLYAWYSGKRK